MENDKKKKQPVDLFTRILTMSEYELNELLKQMESHLKFMREEILGEKDDTNGK
jgi:hypothetical protein